jgi:hypothetical protein
MEVWIMKELETLLEKLRFFGTEGYSENAFKTELTFVAKFYIDNFELETDEVAILLTDKDKMVLSFAFPEYLVDCGMIPISSPDAFASQIFQLGRGAIENNFNQQKHLHLFEMIRSPDEKIGTIWKLMATVLKADNDKFGVIEISRKGETISQTGQDFSVENLLFLERTIGRIAPHLRKVMPPDFKGKLA